MGTEKYLSLAFVDCGKAIDNGSYSGDECDSIAKRMESLIYNSQRHVLFDSIQEKFPYGKKSNSNVDGVHSCTLK